MLYNEHGIRVLSKRELCRLFLIESKKADRQAAKFQKEIDKRKLDAPYKMSWWQGYKAGLDFAYKEANRENWRLGIDFQKNDTIKGKLFEQIDILVEECSEAEALEALAYVKDVINGLHYQAYQE